MNVIYFSPTVLPDIISYIKAVPKIKRRRGNPSRSDKVTVKDVITAFDIETTALPDVEQSFMYVWQFCIYGYGVIIGRTWEEFTELFSSIAGAISSDEKLIVFIHNASYEFQFIRGIYNFSSDEVFAVDKRKVLYFRMYSGKIECRCSYLLTNMTLDQFTSRFNVEHQKLSGEDFDYSKLRFSDTPLTEKELAYCINDVLGLCEAIAAQMARDGDTLQTIPYTSTGYVRRDIKKAMHDFPISIMRDLYPDREVYRMCKNAFRGGDTHANRYYTGDILKGVKSMDRVSSYPDVICNDLFPMSAFRKESWDILELFRNIRKKERAVLVEVAVHDLTIKDKLNGFPYIARHKTANLIKPVIDNGRVLKAEYLVMCVTDVDLRIIVEEYDFTDMVVLNCYSARYAYLPYQIRSSVCTYFQNKTSLKGIPEQEAYYNLSKALLNSIYGMMAQDPLKNDIIYHQIGDPFEVENLTDEELDNKINTLKYKHPFVLYQWGVWVTAWARYRLREGLWLAGHNAVYCDTDSVKYVGEVDFSAYNKQRVRASSNNGAFGISQKGEKFYMGVYEQDASYNEFITLGAKKYAFNYEVGGKSKITLAGVNKSKGGAELDKHGGLQAFKRGFVFTEAGGTEHKYNDLDEPLYYEYNSKKYMITSNIYIRPSTYTIGLTNEYAFLLENPAFFVDI